LLDECCNLRIANLKSLYLQDLVLEKLLNFVFENSVLKAKLFGRDLVALKSLQLIKKTTTCAHCIVAEGYRNSKYPCASY
jgi:hypothetical protein